MKYLFYKDIYYFFRKYLRLFIFYIAIIISFIILETRIGVPLSDNLFFDALGLNCSLEDNFLVILMYLFNIGNFVLLAVLLVKDDITNFTEYIFLRKDKIWWFFNKIISVSSIIFLLKIILYLICYIYFFINNYNIDNIFNLLLHDYMYILLIIMLLFFSYFLVKKFGKLIFVPLVLLLIICKLPINILSFNLVIGFILLFIIVFGLFIILKKSKISIFEK